MGKTGAMLEIRTLGLFSMHIAGKHIATHWPDETLKVFFCSLLSPLDLYFTWDRICRSMWDVPVTRSQRQKLDENVIRPLGSFLIEELGYNPLSEGSEGIRIDQQHIRVDAREFYRTVLEGLRLSSLPDHDATLKTFNRANALYSGSYLPGMPGKIINNARHDLDVLYQTTVMEASISQSFGQ